MGSVLEDEGGLGSRSSMRAIAPLVLGLLLVVSGAGCSHLPLSKEALAGTRTVAIVARIADEAGPHARVFREDASYASELAQHRLEAKEADRRLALVLARGSYQKEADGSRHLVARTVTRYEVAHALRSRLLEALPRRAPWTRALDPVQVASVLESYLVQEVPANAPDYELLRPLGADTVVELVIEEYGMRSEGGRAGAYLLGFARMARVGGAELYRRRFVADDLAAQLPGLEPFVVAKDATLFADRIHALLTGVGALLAEDLSP